MPKKIKITKEQLEKYILECIAYKEEVFTLYIDNLQESAAKFDSSNPPTPPPKPPILK